MEYTLSFTESEMRSILGHMGYVVTPEKIYTTQFGEDTIFHVTDGIKEIDETDFVRAFGMVIKNKFFGIPIRYRVGGN